MEQFEQIRRDRDREGLSLRALAERHTHRASVPACARLTGGGGDSSAAHRAAMHRKIWQRLVDEHGADVAEGGDELRVASQIRNPTSLSAPVRSRLRTYGPSGRWDS